MPQNVIVHCCYKPCGYFERSLYVNIYAKYFFVVEIFCSFLINHVYGCLKM